MTPCFRARATVLLLVGLLNMLLASLIEQTGLTPADHGLGGLFGVARGVLLVLILVILAGRRIGKLCRHGLADWNGTGPAQHGHTGRRECAPDSAGYGSGRAPHRQTLPSRSCRLEWYRPGAARSPSAWPSCRFMVWPINLPPKPSGICSARVATP
ncbi:colicin V production protein [Alcaligenes faecalis subsp. faecalis NCIB 8687]|nr:colicin V production protein [Alcaligenes faecalis subsp. faecalis NCIB 8687]